MRSLTVRPTALAAIRPDGLHEGPQGESREGADLLHEQASRLSSDFNRNIEGPPPIDGGPAPVAWPMTARDLNIVLFVTGLVFLSQIVLARYLLQKEAVRRRRFGVGSLGFTGLGI